MIKKVLLFLLGLGFVYGVLFAIDVLTVPTTTPEQTALAEEYVLKNQKKLPPTAFYHDGCTAFPDNFPGHDFYSTCLHHDIAYWVGGEEAERQNVNQVFKMEMSETGPLGPLLAPILYFAVHHGGDNIISELLGSEWGYGWNE